MVREICLFCRERNWEQGGWGSWWSPCSEALQPAWYTQPAEEAPQPGAPSQPHWSITVAGKLHQLLCFQWLGTHIVVVPVTKGNLLSLSALPLAGWLLWVETEKKQQVAASSEMEITGEGWLWVLGTIPTLRDTVYSQKGPNHLLPAPAPCLGCGWVFVHNSPDLPSSVREQLLIVLASVSRFSSPINLDGITLQWLKKVFCNHYWNWIFVDAEASSIKMASLFVSKKFLITEVVVGCFDSV